MKYLVSISRTGYGAKDIEITANFEARALDSAGEYEYCDYAIEQVQEVPEPPPPPTRGYEKLVRPTRHRRAGVSWSTSDNDCCHVHQVTHGWY